MARHASTSGGSNTNRPHCSIADPKTIGGRFLRQCRRKGRHKDAPWDSTLTHKKKVANPGSVFRPSQWEDPMESDEFILVARYPHSETKTVAKGCCETVSSEMRVYKTHQDRYPVYVYAPTHKDQDTYGEDDDIDDMSGSTDSFFQADNVVEIKSPKRQHSQRLQRRPAIVIHLTKTPHGK